MAAPLLVRATEGILHERLADVGAIWGRFGLISAAARLDVLRAQWARDAFGHGRLGPPVRAGE